MTWLLSNLARYKAEREALEAFGLTHDWFVFGGWRIDDRFRLVLDADILAGDRSWPIFLQYPQFFPDTPPSVFPRGDSTRWSSHQFGAGGELCLEHGPDNWTPDVTGSDVITSAYRLLQGENPGPGITGVVASRHTESLGRRLRSDNFRFLLTNAATAALRDMRDGDKWDGTAVYCHHKDALVILLGKLAASGQRDEWSNPDVPKQLEEEYHSRPIAIVKRGLDRPLPPISRGESAFRAALGLDAEAGPVVLLIHGESVHAYYIVDTGAASLAVIPLDEEQRRTNPVFDALKTKKVALVGCGSLGSKIGAMLTRAGVDKWLLLDDDLLLPENFVRHELDWRDAGSHKATAVARRMEYINPSVSVETWKIQLGAQAAAESVETIMGRIGLCDLIIDATANPNALNVISAIAKAKSKPVVWAAVFGGGIGGFMARYRPGLEPTPPFMRRAIENWFRDQNAPPVRAARRYEGHDQDAPLVANDADVTAIAAHTARFAIDLLAKPASSFPCSVYAIGLEAGSVFNEPFDTKPIDVGPPPAEETSQTLTPEESQAELSHLVGLLTTKTDETPAP